MNGRRFALTAKGEPPRPEPIDRRGAAIAPAGLATVDRRRRLGLWAVVAAGAVLATSHVPAGAAPPGAAWQRVAVVEDGVAVARRRGADRDGRRFLSLRGGAATVAWWRLSIADIDPAQAFTDSRVRLHLRRPVRRAQLLRLAIWVAAERPSSRRGTARAAGAAEVEVRLDEGDIDLILHDQLARLVEEARRSEAWPAGEDRHVSMMIARQGGSRLDRIDFLAIESGGGAEVELCAGECVKIACLGDSNTQSWRGTELEDQVPEVWCETLANTIGRRDWRSHNYGLVGAFAGDLRDEQELLESIGVAVTPERHLFGQFETALRDQSPDIVVAAAGINDLVFLPALFDDQQLADYLTALYAAGTARGISTYVALIQPLAPFSTIPDAGQRTVAINQLLLDRTDQFDGHLVDFYSGFAAEDFVDDVHFGPSGHRERARRVQDALQ
jgi:lysophospholipase L1-like esterase